jgi:hypothetical protein
MAGSTSALGALLLLVLLQGCSQTEPAPQDFTRITEEPERQSDQAKLESARTACQAETKRKGIGSVIGILSRLRPGSSEEDYVACMKARGYDVKS